MTEWIEWAEESPKSVADKMTGALMRGDSVVLSFLNVESISLWDTETLFAAMREEDLKNVSIAYINGNIIKRFRFAKWMFLNKRGKKHEGRSDQET